MLYTEADLADEPDAIPRRPIDPGLPLPSAMLSRPKDRLNSWVVSKATGRPIGYDEADLHPALLEQDTVIERADELRDWLRTAR